MMSHGRNAFSRVSRFLTALSREFMFAVANFMESSWPPVHLVPGIPQAGCQRDGRKLAECRRWPFLLVARHIWSSENLEQNPRPASAVRMVEASNCPNGQKSARTLNHMFS